MPRQTLEFASAVSNDTSTDASKLGAIDDDVMLFQTVGHEAVIEIDDLAGSVGTINWVRHKVVFRGVSVAGKATVTVKVFITDGSGTEYYNETHDAAAAMRTENGTERTTTDGSTTWSEGSVNGIRLKVEYEAESTTNDMMVDYVALIVDYDEAPPETYDATVKNAHFTSGNVYLKSGNVYI
jgi:hypothetical protein